jgi:hypothetical protein
MKVKDLLEDLKIADPDDPIVVVVDDGVDVEALQELEEGSVLEIAESGGFIPGVGRTIRVKPR